MSDYPEHDKLTAIKDDAQVIGEFLDFGGYTLCTAPDDDYGYVPVARPIAQILADYFDIDMVKIEMEKRAMLDELRVMQARR